MKKIILSLLLVTCLFGCAKEPAPVVDDKDKLYLNFDENKLIQYVGDCLSYDVIKDTNGIVPPQNMMCQVLEEPGEVPISITITSKEDSSITETFSAVITVIPKTDDGNTTNNTPNITGEMTYQCDNWIAMEDRFYVGNPNDHEDMHSNITIKVTDSGKIYLLPYPDDMLYWWESDYSEEEPSIYKFLNLTQYTSGQSEPIESGYQGYFVIEETNLYYISGEMPHDLNEIPACKLVTE